MSQSGESDVLIVGAGPTGCAAAIVAARAGFSVTVVDRATFPRDKTCGDAVSNNGMRLLGTLGARRDVESEPHAIVRVAAAVLPDGTRIDRTYDRPGYIVPRLTLDDCLRRAAEKSGAQVLQGVKISRLTRDGERVVGAEGPSLEWRAKVVIAADGHGSVALPVLGIEKPRGRYLGVSATAYYRNVSFPYGRETSDHYFEHDLPFGYGWVFPAVDGISNVGVYLRADGYDRVGRPLKELLDRFLERHADRFADAELVGRVRVWSLPLAPRPGPISAEGLLVAGDAAGFIDPLTGEGIWQGLYTGILAGESAATAIRSGGLTDSIRRGYEQQCHRDVARPSRGKAIVQRAMLTIIDKKLYRSALVRKTLSAGYRGRALEMTKS